MVSRLVRRLAAQVSAYHRRPVTFAARYLLLDGLSVSVRAAAHAKRRVVLAAYGVDARPSWRTHGVVGSVESIRSEIPNADSPR